MAEAGYSGAPLAKKLGIKEGAKVLFVDAPKGFKVATPPGARVVRTAKAEVDVAIIFRTERAGLVDRFLEIAAISRKDAGIWIAWPKKASKIDSDVDENVLREDLLPTGFVDNKVCAIDEKWSGLRFVLRRSAR